VIARPSEDEAIRRRQGVLLLACDAHLQDVRRARRDGDWRIAAPQQLHRSIIAEMRARGF
jgi:hypothetical protein